MTQLHDPAWRGFASDNYAGVHPAVMQALSDANGGHQVAYGDDVYTERLRVWVREAFGPDAEVFPVFNGTGANVVGLQAMMQRWEAVICATSAHVLVDEGGAPERTGGFKLHPVATPDGKLTPALVDEQAWGFGDQHRAQPAVVTITQSTELGTVYTPQEVRALADHVHGKGMRMHMDGARLSNAAAALGCAFREFTADAGVDVLSLGGTKIGAMGAEAVVVLNPAAVQGLPYLRKGAMQLASKMRFVSAQLLALFESDVWLQSARHANAMAARLREAVAAIPGVEVTRAVDANAVFAVLPAEVTARLQQQFRFYTWNEMTGEVRWMASWDTTEDDIDAFAAAVAREMGAVVAR
ncbi:MAG: low specificity L-threonine aldolase [Actinomycetales bacterium]|nr:low specificity L-threonine aldolase [Actinomycetales bacterium]